MTRQAPTLSLADNARLNLGHFLPYLSRGVLTENETRARFWARHQRDPGAVALIGALRHKYRSDYLYVRILARKSLLILSPKGIEHVLEHSPTVYGPPRQKTERMSHFQPNALTISTGADWAERRTFNTAVLQCADGLAPCAERFLAVVRTEVERVFPAASVRRLCWRDFQRLFERIMLQVVFGEGAAAEGLARALTDMMREAGKLTFRPHRSKHFDGFYAGLQARLATAPQRSLLARCKQAPSGSRTEILSQIPHWMFALKDTLAINVVRAFALIVAHPPAEQRIRDDLGRGDLPPARAIHELAYLEGCVQEAMRLWPSTLLLLRESQCEDQIEEIVIPARTQVVIHNGFNHRDARADASADRFEPQRWLQKEVDYRCNHLSNGPQACAGKALALFLAKAVLLALLSQGHFRLLTPRLRADRPLPYVYDHYGVVFERAAPSG